MLVPSPGKVFIKKIFFSLVSKGGILYPDNSKDGVSRTVLGTVLAVGEGIKDIKEGDIIIYDPSAGFELIGGDHFDIADDGFPAIGYDSPSEKRDYCVIDIDLIEATIENYEQTRIY